MLPLQLLIHFSLEISHEEDRDKKESYLLGMPTSSKMDEFSEKFEKSYCNFSEIHDRSIVYNGKNLRYKFFRKYIRFGGGRLPLIS